MAKPVWTTANIGDQSDKVISCQSHYIGVALVVVNMLCSLVV